MSDSLHFADRIVLPYKPSTIVLYAGDNDVSRGVSPETVAENFQRFVAKVHQTLPKTKIIFVAIKPSIRRWSMVEKMRAANAMVRRQCEANPQLEYLDIDKPMLGENGQPRPELFIKDGLHMSDAGYEIWSKLLKPLLP